jgi:hypothetical protein
MVEESLTIPAEEMDFSSPKCADGFGIHAAPHLVGTEGKAAGT